MSSKKHRKAIKFAHLIRQRFSTLSDNYIPYLKDIRITGMHRDGDQFRVDMIGTSVTPIKQIDSTITFGEND